MSRDILGLVKFSLLATIVAMGLIFHTATISLIIIIITARVIITITTLADPADSRRLKLIGIKQLALLITTTKT